MGRASANPTQVFKYIIWYNKSGIFNRLFHLQIIFHSCLLFYTKLLNSYDCAYVPKVSERSSWDSLANLSLWLLLNLINLTPRCSSVSDEKLSLCLERFLWSLVCLCSCVSAALLSWSLFLRFLNLSSFSAAVSAARWARSLSLLRWSFISLAAEDSLLIQLMNVESTLCATNVSCVITHAH